VRLRENRDHPDAGGSWKTNLDAAAGSQVWVDVLVSGSREVVGAGVAGVCLDDSPL